MEFTEEMFCSTITGETGNTRDAKTTGDDVLTELEVVTAFNMFVRYDI